VLAGAPAFLATYALQDQSSPAFVLGLMAPLVALETWLIAKYLAFRVATEQSSHR